MASVTLRSNPAGLRDAYVAAEPFPHIVIDDLFDDDALDRVLAAFPRPEQMRSVAFDNPLEKKLGFSHE